MTLPIAAAKIAAPIVMGLAGNVLGKLAQATGDSARTAAAKSAPSGGIVEAGTGKSRDFAQALEKRLAALPPHQAEKIRKTAQISRPRSSRTRWSACSPRRARKARLATTAPAARPGAPC